jgi:hypothetical protein
MLYVFKVAYLYLYTARYVFFFDGINKEMTPGQRYTSYVPHLCRVIILKAQRSIKCTMRAPIIKRV